MALAIPLKANWKEIPSPVAGAKAYIWGVVRVLVGIELGKWHISISCAHRYPTWEEIKTARYDLVPDDVTMAMLLPPRDQHVNVHENCFHLWQIEGE